MPANARWGRTGWGRTPSSPRRRMPPSFLHRQEPDTGTVTYGEIRFLARNVEEDEIQLSDETALQDEMSA